MKIKVGLQNKGTIVSVSLLRKKLKIIVTLTKNRNGNRARSLVISDLRLETKV